MIVKAAQNPSVPSRIRLRMLGALFIALFYGLLLKNFPLDGIGAIAAAWRAADLFLLSGINIGFVWVITLRWALLIQKEGYRVSFWTLSGYRLAANAVSFITPGPQFGGEPFQLALLCRRHGVPASVAGASVAVDRIMELGLTALVTAGGLAAALYLNRVAAGWKVYGAAAILLATGVSGGVAIGRLLNGRSLFTRPFSFIEKHASRAGAAAWLRSFREGVRTAGAMLRRPSAFFGLFIGLGLFQWALIVFEYGVIYHMSGARLGALELVGLVVMSRLSLLLPIPGGLGALEAGQVFALSALGHDPLVGMAACLVMRLRDLVMVGAGSLLAGHWLLRPLSRHGMKP